MKLIDLHESVEQQRTVTDVKDIKANKYYIHTKDKDKSIVWGPFGKDEATGFLHHAGFERDKNITAKIMKGSDVANQKILSEMHAMTRMMLQAMGDKDPESTQKKKKKQEKEQKRKRDASKK